MADRSTSHGANSNGNAGGGKPNGDRSELPNDVMQLKETIRLMQEQREQLIEQRHRRLIIIGASLSLLFHISLLIYLSQVHHGRGGGVGGGTTAAYEIAVLNEEELDGAKGEGFDELASGPAESDEPQPDAPSLDAVTPMTGESSASPGSIPTLGASGEGSGGGSGTASGGGGGGGMGLGGGGGGGGGTSFFGISSKGTRFAYIVDISGSMGQNRKMETAMHELVRSIEGLPDYSYFYILLFSSQFTQPPMQKGWMRARKPIVHQFANWLGTVDPGGGTEPKSSFQAVFSLPVRPDVIYFLTDGQFEDITPDEIAEMNSHGKKVVINTIQFGDPYGQDALKQIAAKSGGAYRFVASGGP